MIQKLQKPINFYVRGVKFASLINILILLFACNNAQQEGNSSSGKADNILIPVFDTDDNIGYIDITGKWGIQPQFQDGEAFNNVGLARVKQGDTWGVIDKNGKFVIAPIYTDNVTIILDNDGMIRIKQNPDNNTAWTALFDKTGKEIVGFNKFEWIGPFCGLYHENFDSAYYYNNDVAVFRSADTHLRGLIDRTGKIIVEPKFTNIDLFGKNGLTLATLDGKSVVIDQTGKIVGDVPTGAQDAGYASDFGFINQDGKKYGYWNAKTGEFLFEPKYDGVEVDPFVISDLAWVKVNDKYGAIDKNGNMVIEPQFDEPFESNNKDALTPVKKDGLYGYIDKTGKMVIEPKYAEGLYFRSNDLAVVSLSSGKYGAIDKTGKMVIEPKYDYIRICSNDYFILQYNGKYGLVSQKLDTILDFQYSDIKLVPGTKDVFVTEKPSKNGAVLYECGIYANGKHIVMQDVSSFLWM